MLSSTLVDELGYLPFEPQAAHLFFQLVSRRYERGSILITSNRSVGEWGEVFGDAVVATAILDRLLHHSHVLTITGESFRLREKRRAGVLKLSAPPPVTGCRQRNEHRHRPLQRRDEHRRWPTRQRHPAPPRRTRAACGLCRGMENARATFGSD